VYLTVYPSQGTGISMTENGWTEVEQSAPEGVRLVRSSRTQRVQGLHATEMREIVRWKVWAGDAYLGASRTRRDALETAAEWTEASRGE